MFKILLVEDDKELNKTVCTYLNKNGYDTVGCLDANDAYNEMYGNVFDLIISDIMMPKIDGFEFAETVRSLNQEIPILFMTARDDFTSKQRGYRIGIDDYMVKPIDLDELLLKIGALLRRAKIANSKKLTVGKLTLDAEERTAVLEDEDIPLTVREFNLLYKLLSYPKKTFTRSQLMNEFWDVETESSSRTVDVYIRKLREKSMDLEPEILKTNAKLTFMNVLLLTVLFCSIDAIRRKITVERPVKNIISGLNETTKGDFTVRISDVKGIADENGFNIIADQINKMTAELGSLETLRTDFIANVSHELKTPLAAINNYGTLLQSPDLTDNERIEYAKAVTENSRRLANLITNILKLNKLENQQIYPQTEPYNLSEQLCECLLSFETIWEQKNLELDADIDEDIIINADGELLSLVWNNLFST